MDGKLRVKRKVKGKYFDFINEFRNYVGYWIYGVRF